MAFSQDVLLVLSLAYKVKPKQVPLLEIPQNWSLLYHYCKVISQSDRWLIGKYEWCFQLFPGRVLLVTPLQHQQAWITKVGVTASLEGAHDTLNHSISFFFFAMTWSLIFQAKQCHLEMSSRWSCLASAPSLHRVSPHSTHLCHKQLPPPTPSSNTPLLQIETWHFWWQLLTQLSEFHFLRRFQPVKLSYSCKIYARIRQAQQM